MRDALVVDVVVRGVIGKVATDVVMLVRVRRVVLRESLRLLSVVGLVEAVAIQRLLLSAGILFRSLHDNILSSIAGWRH